ncbi:unnamed protein product, partial [Ectocarpus sp. 12 AP-2014]
VLFAALLCPTFGVAGGITISDAYVPLAPKGVMAHAAYMEVTNTGEATRSMVGVTAPDYAMAHIHLSSETDGVATMVSMDQLDIKPGQTVALEPGGLHVMLMKPAAPLEPGGTVTLEVQFANGETMAVSAEIVDTNGS